ncbi:Histone transcription regulator 3 [Arachnomyces sp. PD_36]|nr:Histone transcription regulator 3 [Arachnomyces sp. PD_36]
MSTFVALNIEPDEDSEEEIDDTKEIQVEEALKLYQNALKLHSQGPRYYREASEAYKDLLKSEIFKYPESISDYKKDQEYDFATLELPPDYFDEANDIAFASRDVNDASSNALPQTIYLSYKNHGQFILDSLKELVQTASKVEAGREGATARISTESESALRYFAEALERDDSDLELWRKCSRIGASLQSLRLARYCLESVLEGDDDDLDRRLEQLGIEDAFAIEDLRRILQVLKDRMSLPQIPSKKPRKSLFDLLRGRLDLYPYLPAMPHDVKSDDPERCPTGPEAKRRVITPAESSWTAVGKALLQAIIDENQNTGNTEHSTALGISIPGVDEANTEATAQEAPQTIPLSILPTPRSETDELRQPEKPEPETPLENKETAEVDPNPEAQLTEDLNSAKPADEGTTADEEAAGGETEGNNQEASESPNQQDAQPENTSPIDADTKTSNLPSRKRSSASIGNEEPVDGGRGRSKRIRARESNAEALMQAEEVPFDQARYYEDRLEIYAHADQWMFSTVSALLSKTGVEELGTIDELKQILSGDGEAPSKHQDQATLFSDLRGALEKWNDEKARASLHGKHPSPALQGGLGGMKRFGLSVFLEHSRKSNRKPGNATPLPEREGLSTLLQNINGRWLHFHEVAFLWLEELLTSKYESDTGRDTDSAQPSNFGARSTYAGQLWPEALKETVVQIIIREDEFIYNKLSKFVSEVEEGILQSDFDTPFVWGRDHFSSMEMIQTLYELHLDIYALINNPNSEVDQSTRVMQRERLNRWGYLSRASVNHYMDSSEAGATQSVIGLRHLWASTFHSNMAEDSERQQVLLYLYELKRVMISFGNPVIMLANNAIMPEISASALDQEVSRLSSMEFFMRVFSSESEDPVSLIESLEPILEPSSVEYSSSSTPEHTDSMDDDDHVHTINATPPAHLQEMISFLDRGDATLRLLLWKRLQDAYKAIDYPPKVISCYLRSIEVIVRELHSRSYSEGSDEHRQLALLSWLRSIDDILGKILKKALHEPEISFECVDMAHLQTSMSAVARLSKLLHTFALYEDSLRVGQTSPPELPRASLNKSLEGFKENLREMQIRVWTLQYALVKEAIKQNPELFDTPADDQVHYLRSVHNAHGIRQSCKYSNKVLLKLMGSELLTLQTEDSYESDISQVLFDLHGLKFSTSDGAEDHGCPPEKLDRTTAMDMVDFVMMQANRINIKDLSKTELKTSMDKMQLAIGMTKSCPALNFNRRVLSAFLKSPIDPSELYRAVQGIGDVSMVPVHVESSKIADKGWYFIIGHAALAKFRSQKRINPIPTDDLDVAIIFLKQDLEHVTERWESWYRLGQAYDSKLEEDITWSADKLNGNRADLVKLQRSTIHCYTMALATAMRTPDMSPEEESSLSDLYTDFAIRLYASSRVPLSMEALSLEDFARHFSSGETQQMYKSRPFKEMDTYSVWNFASYLLKLAIVDKPKHWFNQYMLSKCRWKMFCSSASMRGGRDPIQVQDVVDSLIDTIQALPEKKDSRSEPILEPHFKLVSIVHKLVHQDFLEPSEASKILLATPWAANVRPAESAETWEPYILEVLKNLAHADKSHWHHRISSRAAHIVYDDRKDDVAAAAAKHELTQQIVTKTMNLQVWRPEHERPGRHFVYTTRYVYFFAGLLNQLNDRTNLDMLLRRVRRKPTDYLNHTKLWEDISGIYIKLLRRLGNIPDGHEETVFKPVTHDDYSIYSVRLERWSHLPSTDSPIIDLLRDAVELKKLNNNLMKVAIFEDLIADIYAVLYENNIAQFMEQVTEEESRERMRVDHLLMNDNPAGTTTPPTSAPVSEAPAPRTRTKGVTRREVQRKADAIVSKALAARQQPVKPTRPAEEVSRPVPVVEITVPAHPIKEDLKEEASAFQSSAPGSVHDSADDESELSEIDEEKLAEPAEPSPKPAAPAAAPLFPNLMRKKASSPNPTSELSTATSVNDGDGGDGGCDPVQPAQAPQEDKSETTEP